MEQHVYLKMAEISHRHWWFISRRAIVSTLLRRLDLAKTSKIVEFGCGPGGELAMLSQFGSVSAVEPSDLARGMAQSLAIANIHAGSLPDEIPFEAGSVDLAVCLDVLEHVGNDLAGLKAVRKVLRREGWLLMTVPAFPFLFDQHDVSHHHFRRYRRVPLRALLEAAGFEPFFVGHINCFLFPVIVLNRLFDRAMARSRDYDELPPAWINRLLTAVFSAERHLVQRLPLPFGVSLVALARPAGAKRRNSDGEG